MMWSTPEAANTHATTTMAVMLLFPRLAIVFRK